LDRVLKGLDDFNDDDITFLSYLAQCENLLPLMIKKNIIQKILATLNKLMDRHDNGQPLKEKSIKNLTKILMSVCRLDNTLVDKFLGYDGFETVSRLLDLKNLEINTGILPFIAYTVQYGPITVVPTLISKDIPKKLMLFWEETKPFIIDLQNSYKGIKDFKERVVADNAPVNKKESDALEKYKMIKELMESGFFVFDQLAEKNPTIFEAASPKFHAASACHLNEFRESIWGQNLGMEF